MTITLTAVFQQVPEGFIGFIEELPGANTHGATLDETRGNLTEAIALVLEANRMLAEEDLQGRTVIREDLHLSLMTRPAESRLNMSMGSTSAGRRPACS